MHRLGIGLIWSPRSNYELYGATADVIGAKAAGVTIALAPDWSPTGSDGLLGELKYAAAWNETQPEPPFDDRALFRMATAEAARLAGADDKIGALKAGLYADLLVLARSRPDAYAALDHAAPADVELVVASGQPVYGDPALAQAARPEATWTRIPVGSAVKAVAFPAAGPADDWAHTTAALDAALTALGSHLAPLVE
jgi:cytosine/adenosine deaminase-related metal-dependent hydrolase